MILATLTPAEQISAPKQSAPDLKVAWTRFARFWSRLTDRLPTSDKWADEEDHFFTVWD